MGITTITASLQHFIGVDKYKEYEDMYGLSDCTSLEDQNKVNDLLNRCVSDLLTQFSKTKKPSHNQLSKILDHYNAEIPTLLLDTEDREFAYEMIVVLMEKTSFDPNPRNDKMHFLKESLDALFSEEKITKTCMECGHEFSIFIHEKDESIPECWVIIRCGNCRGVDYIELPAGLAETTYRGFDHLEVLNKNEFSRPLIIELVQRLQAE